MSKSPIFIPSPISTTLRRTRVKPLRFVALGALTLLGVIIYACAFNRRPPQWREDGWLAGFDEECRHWIPTEAGTDGGCPAAARLREVQAFLREPVYE